MNIYYNVKLDAKTEDIKKVENFEDKIKNIYLLSDIEPNLKNDIKLKHIKEFTINNEILTFALNSKDISKLKNKIFRKIKHIKIHNKKILNNYFQVIVFNYKEENDLDIMDLIKSIKVMLLANVKEKYEYIYDSVCDYLDNEFICKNICEFKDNKCIAKRDFNLECGCCRHYKSLLSNQFVQCEYLINRKCSTKCLTCKMFTCDYIVKHKGIKYTINDIFLLRKFFNPIQKIIILVSYFTSKEKIIKRLLIWR